MTTPSRLRSALGRLLTGAGRAGGRRGVASASGDADARPAIEKLLVANRGEIACRVMTTAKRLGRWQQSV